MLSIRFGFSQRESTQLIFNQISIQGLDRAFRSELAFHFEGIARKWETYFKTKINRNQNVRLNIVLHKSKDNLFASWKNRFRFLTLGDQLVIKLHLNLGEKMPDWDWIDQVFLKALLLVSFLDNEKLNLADKETPAIPDWLTLGMNEWLNGVETFDSRKYRVLLNQFPWELDELFIRQSFSDLDGVNREIYRSLAGLLWMSLLELPSGKEHLPFFLKQALFFSGDWTYLLKSHFPSLDERRSVFR